MTAGWLYDGAAEFARGEAVDFSRGHPVEMFCGLTVYVQFDADQVRRRPVVRDIPGQPGRWIIAYSSLERLVAAVADPDVEYSFMRGESLLAQLPDRTGVWFDRAYPGGRPILLPAPEIPGDVG